MTPLHKPVWRKTSTRVRDVRKPRILVAGMLPGDIIRIRFEACRKHYDLTVEQVYRYAAKLEGERIRRERKANRKKA